MYLKKPFLLLILSLTYVFTFSQTTENLSVKLKDFHSATIREVILSSDEKNFISSDESGKIILHNTANYTYNKTLRASSGIPITNMRLVRNDSLLLFNQKYEYSNGELDSLIGIRIHDSKVIFKNKFSGSFIDSQDDVILLKTKNQFVHIIEVFDNNFNKITATYPSKDVKLAAFNKANFTIAYVENDLNAQTNLVLFDIKTAKELFNIPLAKETPVIHLFFDHVTNKLYSLNANEKENRIDIYNLTDNPKFEDPVFSTLKLHWLSHFKNYTNVSTSLHNNTYKIILSEDSKFAGSPIIIGKEGENFKGYNTINTPKLKYGSNYGIYLKSKQEYLFFESFYPSQSDINTYSVTNEDLSEITYTYPEEDIRFYYGSFLPNNNWMVLGNVLKKEILSSYEYKIKYYETGTFNNRFGKLNYNNYLETKHNIVELNSAVFVFDKLTGIHPFYGYEKNGYNNDYGFFSYDLIKDRITRISNDRNERIILDYNANQNYLLLSAQKYTNGGYTEPQELFLVKGNESLKLNGKYKFGKLSNNGNYLLTINNSNKAEIHTTSKLKTVYEEQLTDGRYHLFSVDENGFAISNEFYEIDLNKCNKESIIIGLENSSNFSSKKTDCLKINDIAYSNNKVAILADAFGIVINDKILPFKASEFPEHISFNKDASKLMVSFNNGKNAIYDSETLQEIGKMLHTNKDEHVFVDDEGNYFSNVTPDKFLIAKQNSNLVDFKKVEAQLFNPEKILSLFGVPNAQYVEALRKAMSLKSNSNETIESFIEEQQDTFNTDPELYVLTIGVSDYLQSDYNLTFADKDAMDIANIYGTLSDKELFDYNTKFYGNGFDLTNSNETFKAHLKKYSKVAKIYDLHAVSADNTKWLEFYNEQLFLWNFKEHTIEEINIPENLKINTYNFENSIRIEPNNNGFYLISEDNTYYLFKFNAKEFIKIKTPFEDKNVVKTPLTKNRWSYFESIFNGTTYQGNLYLTNTNSNEISNISFDLNIVNRYSETGEKTIDTLDQLDISTTNFKGISSDGNLIAYTTFDSFYIVDISVDNPIPTKLNIDNSLINYNSKVYFSNDGKSFSILNNFINDYKYHIDTFDLTGKKIDNFKFNGKNDFSVVGLSIYNNELFWIKFSEPLLQEAKYFEDTYRTETAKSFSKTHVKYLTNSNANSEMITSELYNFFKSVKSNDQIIVFLAGHGVLDKDLNYYFAPYDMDFKDVSKNGVSLQTIVNTLNKSRSNNILLLMDSCHSGNTLDMTSSETTITLNNNPNERGSRSKKINTSKFKISEIISELFEDFLSTSGITIISASSGEDVAYENKDLGNGAFTSAYIKQLKAQNSKNAYMPMTRNDGTIIEGMTRGLGKVDLTEDIISNILKEVMIITNGKQIPDLREFNKSSNLKMW